MHYKSSYQKKLRRLPVFLLLIIMGGSYTKAQQPGGPGVPGVKVWLVPFRDGVKYKWTSLTNFPGILQKKTIPVTDTLNINFQTALRFRSAPFHTDLSNLKPVSVVTALFPNIAQSAPGPDSFYSIRYNFLPLVRNEYHQVTDAAGNTIQKPAPFTGRPRDMAMKVSAVYFSDYPVVDKSTPGGQMKETRFSMTLDGYCPEVLLYETALSDLALHKLQTYFAMKYGITLPTSYMGSGDNVLWNKQDRQQFHHRVCAIGKDVAGALWLPQANTVYEEGSYYAWNNHANGSKRSVTIGFTNTAPAAVPDKSFLFWGDDDGAIDSYRSSRIRNADTSGRIRFVKRNWLMQNDQQIAVPTRVELGGALLEELSQPRQCYLLINVSQDIDSSDIYPLNKNVRGKWLNDKVKWEQATDTFTFGKVKLLEFIVRYCIGDSYNENLSRGELLYRNRFLQPDLHVGYKYRTAKSRRITQCVDPLPPGSLECYLSGGIGPYLYKTTSSGTYKLLPTLEEDGLIIGTISGLAAGSYTITVTDMTRQETQLSVQIP